MLLDVGAIRHGDSRLQRKDRENDADLPVKSIRQSKQKTDDDEDSDWD